MRLLASALVGCTLLIPAVAHAQEDVVDSIDTPPPSPWSFEVAVGTDNRSKDASKSDGEAFATAAVEWAPGDSGFYVALSGETIDHSTGADLEGELSAGWAGDAGPVELDLNAAHKWLFNANPGSDDTAWEFTADFSRDLTDRVDARIRLQYSPDSAGSTRSWTWVEMRGRVRVTDRIRLSAAIGRREQVNSRDYTGWNIGADFEITDTLGFDLRWHDTDQDDVSNQYDGALVGVLTAEF